MMSNLFRFLERASLFYTQSKKRFSTFLDRYFLSVIVPMGTDTYNQGSLE